LCKAKLPPVIAGVPGIDFDDDIGAAKNRSGVLVGGSKERVQQFRVMAIEINRQASDFADHPGRFA